MRAEYDFCDGKRGRLVPIKHKNRVVINLDHAILNALHARAEKQGSVGFSVLPSDMNEPEKGQT